MSEGSRDATLPAWVLEMQLLERAIQVKRTEMRDMMQVEAQKPTAWIGGIPLALARHEDGLRDLLSSYGELEKLSVRIKAGENRSWCLATFLNEDALERLARAPIAVVTEGGENGGELTGGRSVFLAVEEADVQGHLRREGDQGKLAEIVAEHEAKKGAYWPVQRSHSSLCLHALLTVCLALHRSATKAYEETAKESPT
eukprot:COSAG03_NODE_2796_length_2448_cov_1.770115_2_plen_199_part_00